MRSLIVDKGEHYYTYMGGIFQAIEHKQKDYNWLITSCDCFPQDEEIKNLFWQKYLWISGEELTEIINKEDFQFIWGDFTGFKKDISLQEVLKYALPDAESEDFWKADVKIQHPLAEVEIVAWDSSLTIFISKTDELADKFMEGFPQAENLAERNRRRSSQIEHIENLLIKELEKKNITITNEILNSKYQIWRNLYLDRETMVNEKEILIAIEKFIQIGSTL